MDKVNLKLKELQPSQLYISIKKLKNINLWFNPTDFSNFDPIPIKLLDGEPVITDGHTRVVAAIIAGLDTVPLVWDTDDLDWDMYRECVKACRKQNIYSPTDLVERIISEEDYKEKWDNWCDELHAKIIRKRKEQH